MSQTTDTKTSTRPRRPTRWEKARVGILGAGVLGLIAETILTQRWAR